MIKFYGRASNRNAWHCPLRSGRGMRHEMHQASTDPQRTFKKYYVSTMGPPGRVGRWFRRPLLFLHVLVRYRDLRGAGEAGTSD